MLHPVMALLFADENGAPSLLQQEAQRRSAYRVHQAHSDALAVGKDSVQNAVKGFEKTGTIILVKDGAG